MIDLSHQLRALVARHHDPNATESPRTTRTTTSVGGPDRDIARCARGSASAAGEIAWRDELPVGASVVRIADAAFVYDERLGIAADLGMDTAIGSEAELIARREARRVASGLPPELTRSRGPDVFDAALAAFAPMGGLTCVHVQDREVAS